MSQATNLGRLLCRSKYKYWQYQTLAVEEHLRISGDGKFHIFLYSRFSQKMNHLENPMRTIS